MKSILVVPFATPLHGKEYYAGVLEAFRKFFEPFKIDFMEVIESEDQAIKAGEKCRNVIPIILVLTGGVSPLVKKFVDTADIDKALVLAHGEHNSLASAISIRSRLELSGVSSWVFTCDTPHSLECSNVVYKVAVIAKVLGDILGSRIAFIGVEDKSPEIEELEARIEAQTILISMNEFLERIQSAPRNLVEHFLEEIKQIVAIEIPEERLEEVGRIYAALRNMFEELKLDAIAVNCFPYLVKSRLTPCLALALLNAEGYIAACEADSKAVFLMMISRALTGFSGWIANVASIYGSQIMFAHCTAPLNMVKNPRSIYHFESGYPYSLTGELLQNVYTFTSVSPDFAFIAYGLGRIVRTGFMSYTACRTQALVELGIDGDKFINLAPTNHHVAIPGDVREYIKIIATLLDMDYAEYTELASMF